MSIIEELIIVSTADNSYAQHMGVMLCSVYKNNLKKLPITVYVIDAGIDTVNIEKLKSSASGYGAKLHFLVPPEDIFDGYPIDAHASLSVYYRLALAKYLPENISRIIYLDADIVLVGDISYLLQVDLINNVIGAVFDPYANLYFEEHPVEDLQPPHFNSGVMVINVPEWRKQNISEIATKYISSHADQIVWWDQDGLNFALNGKWLPLPSRYNIMTSFLDKQLRNQFEAKTLNDIDLALSDPAIIHFTGKMKPWLRHCWNPFGIVYWQHLRTTPWKDYELPPFVFRKAKKYYIEQIVPSSLRDIYEKLKTKFKSLWMQIK